MVIRTEKRTQIYLTGQQHGAASALARVRGTSLAGVVREALDEYLARAQGEHGPTWEGDPAFDLIGKLALPVRSPRHNLVEDIDLTVYEETRQWSSPTAPDSSPRSTRAKPDTQKRPRRGARSRKRASRS